MAKGIFDQIWGVERYKESEAFGDIVVPVAVLWDRPGNLDEKNPVVSGALPHAAQVLVTNQFEIGGSNWSKVEADVWHNGTLFHQVGWLRNSLLKEAGANEY